MSPRSILCVALSAVLAGCGSSSKSSPQKQLEPALRGPAPPSLVGVYTTKLTKRDLSRNHAPELQEAPGWKLTIANVGGTGSGHVIALTNMKAGALESSDFAISKKRIVVKHEECAAGGTTRFYDNEYRFKQSGNTLRFTKLLNSCPDRVAETVLTAEPWTKQPG
jgi:hypothetical protein